MQMTRERQLTLGTHNNQWIVIFIDVINNKVHISKFKFKIKQTD